MKEKTRDLITVVTLVFIASLMLIIFVILLSAANREKGSVLTLFKSDTTPLIALLAGVSLGSLVGLIVAQKIVGVGSGLLESESISKKAEIRKTNESFAFEVALMLLRYINAVLPLFETYVRQPEENLNRARFWAAIVYVAEGLVTIRAFDWRHGEIVLAIFRSHLFAIDSLLKDLADARSEGLESHTPLTPEEWADIRIDITDVLHLLEEKKLIPKKWYLHTRGRAE